MPRPFHLRRNDLPQLLPIFPLPGVLLLPDGKLPLNIFEPRYLAMIQDALGWGRLIGMVQPSEIPLGQEGNEVLRGDVPLFQTGCAGRISSFAETEDGRLMITLTGVCRFRVGSELESVRGYRRIAADWEPYLGDLDEPPAVTLDRPRLMAALKTYSKLHNLDLNWKAIERADDYELTVSLSMVCPFEPREQQALLESHGEPDVLITLLEMAAADPQGGMGLFRQ